MVCFNKYWTRGQLGACIAVALWGCGDSEVCVVEACEPLGRDSGGTGGESAAGSGGSGSEGGAGSSGGGGSAGMPMGGSGSGGQNSQAGTGGGSSGNSCSDGARNGDESDVDCGGSCDDLCADLQACGNASDCSSGVCTGSVCSAASCDDGVSNGDEADLDCGGSCGSACAAGQSCLASSDCLSALCTDGACEQPSCTDGVENGSETAVDCGGNCDLACADGLACTLGTDCSSASCVGSVCAAANCQDGALNGTETAIDCGGSCNGCARGQTCSTVADCGTIACVEAQCVVGPTAALQLSVTTGTAPLSIAATSLATAGDAAIVATTYQFEADQGFGAQTEHTYTIAGSHTVTQRVTDDSGLVSEASTAVFVASPVIGDVLFSETDISSQQEVLVAADGLTLELVGFDRVGARTEVSVAPGSGFFYYEGQRLSEPYFFSFGIVTAGFPLSDTPGGNSQSVGVETTEGVQFNATNLGGVNSSAVSRYGFAVDYRGTSPVVYVIAGGSLVATANLTVTEPVYVYAGGLRSIVGPQLRINTGNDTQNFPFFYDVAAILETNAISSSGLVLGFGATHAAVPSDAPVLGVQGAGSVALGGTISLTATATDTEDGNLAGSIRWTDLALPYAERPVLVGESANFTLDVLGVHPIEVTVTDNSGQVARQVVDIPVTGTLPSFDPVRLVADARSGAGIVVAADGVSAKFFNEDKYGIRANQGLLNGYQYFEIRRLGAAINQGGGLVIADGNLNPYDPIDVPASCSVNYETRIWRNLISVASYDEAATEYYGFAVDYRGRTPRVHVITQNTGGASVFAVTLDLDDVTVPIYPLLYGNPTNNGLSNDATMNFTGPFQHAPATVLTAAGVDVTGLQVSWGE